MSSIQNICVITNNYPQPRFRESGAFVERHVAEWQKEGLSINIIHPLSVPSLVRTVFKKKSPVTIAGEQIERPIHMSYSSEKVGPIDLGNLSQKSFLKATEKTVKKLPVPDVYYGKFLMTGGAAAAQAGQSFSRPAIADLGESRLLEKMDKQGKQRAKETVKSLDGFVCVSQRLVDELQTLGADPNTILLAPNTVDLDRFHPMSQEKCRAQLGLSQKEFIVAFVGHFIKRKGPLRLLKAINALDIPVKGIFIGRPRKAFVKDMIDGIFKNGKQQKPEGEKVLYADAVPNKKLPIWLNAADVFVMPTLAEGNCNAINEAMACGLPIISSDIPDVRPQVPEDCGILVDPSQIQDIADAIEKSYHDQEMLNEYGKNCEELSKKRFSKSRAVSVLDWMKDYSEV